MIAVHLRKIIVFSANRADTFLTLIGFSFLRIGKGSDAEISLLTVKDICVYSFLVADIIVSHKFCDSSFESIGMEAYTEQ